MKTQKEKEEEEQEMQKEKKKEEGKKKKKKKKQKKKKKKSTEQQYATLAMRLANITPDETKDPLSLNDHMINARAVCGE